MQISIDRDLLLRSLTKVRAIAADRRSTIPILEHVKIDITYSHVRLTTTNSEIMISDVFSTRSDFSTSFTTIASILYEIVKKIYDSSEIIFILEDDKGLVIKAGRSKFRLPCMPVEDFPTFDMNIVGYKFHIKASALAYLLQHTEHAISSGEIRYYLNGAFLHVIHKNDEEQVLRAVTTDSFRLASAEINFDSMIDKTFGLIIPRRTVHELLKLLQEVGDEVIVEIIADHNRIVFITPDTQLASKVIDAKFPDYKDIVLIKNDKILTVNAKDLKCGIDLVTSVSNAKDKEVRLVINQETIDISIEDKVVYQSYGSQKIQAIFDSARSVEILLNSRYLTECLNAIKGEVVEIRIDDELAPIVIQDRSDKNVLYVLMPLHAQNS